MIGYLKSFYTLPFVMPDGELNRKAYDLHILVLQKPSTGDRRQNRSAGRRVPPPRSNCRPSLTIHPGLEPAPDADPGNSMLRLAQRTRFPGSVSLLRG